MNGVGRLVKDGREVIGDFFADRLIRELSENDVSINPDVHRFIWSEG